MNCPFCGNEMMKGFVQSSRAFFFATDYHGILFKPCQKKGEFYLSSHNWTSPICAAYHCANCKKVIADYAEEVESIW